MMAVLGAVMAVHSACPRAPVMSTGARRAPRCRLTQSKRQPSRAHDIVSTYDGQLTHSDTWGPFMDAPASTNTGPNTGGPRHERR